MAFHLEFVAQIRVCKVGGGDVGWGGRWREGRMKGISGHDSKSEGMMYDSFPPSSLSLLGM